MSDIFLAHIAIFLFGLIGPLIKATSANVWTIALARLFFGILVIALFIFAWRRQKISFTQHFWKKFLIGLTFGVHWVFYFWAFMFAKVSTITFAEALYAVFLVFLAFFFCDEKWNRKDIFPFIIAIAGGVLLLPSFDIQENETIGFFLALGSAFLFAVLSILQKKYQNTIAHEERAFFQYLFAFLFFSLFFPLSNWDLSFRDWGILGVLGILCTGVAHTLWARVNATLSTKTNVIIHFLIPVYSTVLAVLFLAEDVDLKTIIGGGLVLFSNFLLVRQHKV